MVRRSWSGVSRHRRMLSEATSSDSSFELTPEERRNKARKTTDFFQVVRTRIFTVSDIKQLDVEREWRVAHTMPFLVGPERLNLDANAMRADTDKPIVPRLSRKTFRRT